MIPSFLNKPFGTSPLLGFTLSELLIGLVLLGVIATFTLPKLLNGTLSAQDKATGKEAMATLEHVLYEGWQSGTVNANTTQPEMVEFLKSRLNYTQFCPAGSNTDPCYATSMSFDRFFLASGASITVLPFWNTYLPGDSHLVVDINGVKGPNISEGSYSGDVLILWYNRTQNPLVYGGRYDLKPGQLGPDYLNNRHWAYVGLYQ